MTNTMAFAISTPTSSLLHNSSSSSCNNKPKPPFFFFSSSTVSTTKNPIFQHVGHFSQLGFAAFPQWSGLKQLGSSMPRYSVKMGRKGKKCEGKGVFASLFGVGAPEALVIGVVALLVFGPKGLAEVARNFGKTLRSFQPTIRELQEVSREFKSTLEREIGLDEVDNRVPRSLISNNPTPTTPVNTPEALGENVKLDKSSDDVSSPSSSGAYTADEYLKVTEAQLTGALARLQKEQEEEKEKPQNQPEPQTPSQDAPQEEAASVAPPGPAPKPETEI